jgi:anthranilate/para-aminobenzoate synthase component II
VSREWIVIVGPDYYEYPFCRLGEITHKLRTLLTVPHRIKLVVFTGGEDIHPSLYGSRNDAGLCFSNRKRDVFESNVFRFCREHNIRMTGICRGFQLLNVMAGGFMYHHLDRHSLIGFHNAYFPHMNNVVQVTSTHHQLVGLPDDALPIAWAQPKRSTRYIGPDGKENIIPEREIEAAAFPDINAMGVQYHPEAMWDSYRGQKHYVRMIECFIRAGMGEFIKEYTRRVDNARSRSSEKGRKVRRANRP